MLFGKILIAALGHVLPIRLTCVHIKPGVLDQLQVVGSLMFTCRCPPRVSGRCSSLGWVVMAYLAMLVHG